MAKNDNVKDFTKDIADALRVKKNSSDLINPQDFSNHILAITTGDYNIEQVVDGDACELHITLAESDKLYRCCVIDYDGTFLADEYHKTGETFNLPQLPNHSKLEFQEWTNTAPIIDNSVIVETQDIIIRPIYTTKSGLCEFDFDLNNATAGLQNYRVHLFMTGTKDWGDGTVDTLTMHTYTSYGKYTITCDGTDFNFPDEYDYNIFGANYYEQSSCKEIRFGSNITSIPNYAFTSCIGLKTVTIPNGVISLGEQYNCTGLENLTLPNTLKRFEGVQNTNRLNIYAIPDNVRYVRDACSSGTIMLKLPNDLTIYGHSTFKGTRHLKNIVVPDAITVLETGVFRGCSNLQTAVLPQLTDIPDQTFLDCSSLSKIDIAFGVLTLGKSVFNNCVALQSLVLPDTVTTIGDSCFKGCCSLKALKLSESLTELPRDVFNGCSLLRELRVPKNVVTLQSGWANGTAFDTVYFSQHETVPTLNGDFGDCIGFVIVVPDALYDQWCVAENWSTYSGNIKKVSEVIN